MWTDGRTEGIRISLSLQAALPREINVDVTPTSTWSDVAVAVSIVSVKWMLKKQPSYFIHLEPADNKIMEDGNDHLWGNHLWGNDGSRKYEFLKTRYQFEEGNQASLSD